MAVNKIQLQSCKSCYHKIDFFRKILLIKIILSTHDLQVLLKISSKNDSCRMDMAIELVLGNQSVRFLWIEKYYLHYNMVFD